MKKVNYVNNVEFTKKISEFAKAKADDETMTLRIHPNGDYIGHCIMEICTNLAKLANFCNYTYKDEMISDAIENCVKACKNFDPEKSSNAFGYFTQIASWAFIRRIQKEKKQTEKKMLLLSSHKALSEIISKQFDDGMPGSEHEGNVQHFVEQLQAALVENEQLIEIQQVLPVNKKVLEFVDTPLSKYFEADAWQ